MTNALQLTDEQIRQMAPLQRAGNEDDIGGMILYLASKVSTSRPRLARDKLLGVLGLLHIES